MSAIVTSLLGSTVTKRNNTAQFRVVGVWVSEFNNPYLLIMDLDGDLEVIEAIGIVVVQPKAGVTHD